jgi:biotin carboxylase
MMLAAKVRAALSVPGMTAEQTLPFRDKVVMKEVLDRAGVRSAKRKRARTVNEVRAAIEELGYPVVVKPIAGAGSADTHALREAAELERVLPELRGVDEVTVEEFVQGEEHTHDTICAQGEILFENVAWYRPTPLVAKQNEWISAQSTCLRDLERPEIRLGRELGRRVLRGLEWDTGFTHMEWFLTDKGEAVFGEIGGRPAGARLVHLMNYTCDADLFRGWADAVCNGRISQDLTKKYNAGVVFKRAVGSGIVRAYEGLDRLMARYGEHVCVVDLAPIGSPRRDWRSSAVGDGWIVVRHPDLDACLRMGDAFASELRLIAS